MSTRATITPSNTVRCSSGQISTEVKGERVMLSLSSGKYYSLNPVGVRVWELIAESILVSALVDRLAEEYAADRTKIEADVIQLLSGLAAAGLVDVS